ncbi:MAG: transposase [Janthinobacterium lividum]
MFRRAQTALIMRARAAGLVDAMPVAAVDATGLETRHVSANFGLRRGGVGHRQRTWPKLTAVVHTASHLIVGAVPGTGPSQDSPDFIPAMRQAAELVRFDTALADAGYDAEHNHRLCREELGLRQSVIALNPRNAGKRPPRTPYRHALWRDFPTTTYHQRWHVESAFSQHKRRLGSALTARCNSAQQHELVLRVLTHNIALLAASA